MSIKLLSIVLMILLLIAVVTFCAYYRPTLEMTWFGRTVTLF
jgi:hypothetical protein